VRVNKWRAQFAKWASLHAIESLMVSSNCTLHLNSKKFLQRMHFHGEHGKKRKANKKEETGKQAKAP
jgi:hypothetical protein